MMRRRSQQPKPLQQKLNPVKKAPAKKGRSCDDSNSEVEAPAKRAAKAAPVKIAEKRNVEESSNDDSSDDEKPAAKMRFLLARFLVTSLKPRFLLTR